MEEASPSPPTQVHRYISGSPTCDLRKASDKAQVQAKSIAAPAYRTSPCPRSSKEHRRSCVSHIAVPKIQAAESKEVGRSSICTTINKSRDFSDLDAGTGDPEEVIAEGSGVALDVTTRVLD